MLVLPRHDAMVSFERLWGKVSYFRFKDTRGTYEK